MKSNKSKQLHLHYSRGITTKRVTSGEAHLCDLASRQHSSEKRSSGGKSLTTLCPIRSALASNPRPTAPKSPLITTATPTVGRTLQLETFREVFETGVEFVKMRSH